MNQRVKELRKHLSLTQDEFAQRVGLSRNFIAQIELGSKEPSERTVSDICREFGVNETWLRTGEGEMLKPKSRVDEIAEIVDAALENTPEEARQSLIDHIRKLTDAEVVLLAQMIDRRFPE